MKRGGKVGGEGAGSPVGGRVLEASGSLSGLGCRTSAPCSGAPGVPPPGGSCTPGLFCWGFPHPRPSRLVARAPRGPSPGTSRSERPSGWQLPGLGCCSQERLGYNRRGPGVTPLTPGLPERWPCVQVVGAFEVKTVLGVDFNARIKLGDSYGSH